MLDQEQRAAIAAEAKRRGIDENKLLAEAERISSKEPSAAVDEGELGSVPKDKPNLFMYLLPFVTVNEVRTIWLELDPVAGGEQYAAEWAAKQTASSPTPGDPPVNS